MGELVCDQCGKSVWEATGEPDRDRCAACGTPARHPVEERTPEVDFDQMRRNVERLKRIALSVPRATIERIDALPAVTPEEWAGIAEAAFVGSAKFEETGWDG